MHDDTQTIEPPKQPAASKLKAAAPPRPARAFDCLSCGHCQLANPAKPEQGGVCHRFPPQVFPVGVNSITKQPLTMGFYPLVGRGDWCGEHTAAALNVGTVPKGDAAAVQPREPVSDGGQA